MILNPDVARVLDKAAEKVSEVAVMPSGFLAHKGREQGDDQGFDAITAITHAAIDLDLMDIVELRNSAPHVCEIARQVADFGGVPNDDRETQDMRFEVAGKSSYVTDRLRRSDDLLSWARGLPTTEVAQLFRWAADEFRARPAGEGVYDVYGTHEYVEAFNDSGIWLRTLRTIVTTRRQMTDAGMPEVMINQLVEQFAGQPMLAMIDSVFGPDTTPNPDAAVIVNREDVTPTRLAELTGEVISLINELGWCDTYVFRPDNGKVSTVGALAVLLGIPPRADYLKSRVHRLERRFAEMWAVMEGVGDFLALPDVAVKCSGCGEDHSRDRFMNWEDESGRTQDEVVAALTGFRDAQITLAAIDAIEDGVPTDEDWNEFARQLSAGQEAPRD